MQTILHRDGEQFAIVTTAETEDQFRGQFAEAMSLLIADNGEEISYLISSYMAPASEIVCKFRGYKSTVVEQRTLIAGHIDPDAALATAAWPPLAIAQ